MSALNTKLRRDLARQKAPFLAVALTILLGVGLFAVSYDAYLNLTASYDGVFERLSTADHWISGGDTGAIAEDSYDVAGVAAVDTRVRADVALRVGGDELVGRVVSTGDDLTPAVNRVGVLEGDAGGVMAEQHLYDHFGLSPGETVEVLGPSGEWEEVTVSGSVVSAEYLWPARSRQDPITLPGDFGVLFTTSEVARELTGATGPNQVVVRYEEGADVDALHREMAAIADEHGASGHFSLADQPSNSVLEEDLTGFSQMALLFPALFLTAAGMATYVLMSRRIRNERSVIGMLRAQGMSRRKVLGHYLRFGLAAGLVGAVPGVGLGLLGAASLSRYYTDFIDLPFTQISFHPQTVAIGLAFGVVAGGLAAWAPARRAAAITPAEAMRGIVPVAGGGRTWAERIVPGSGRLPVRAKMVLRSIGRNPRRTAMTAGGVVLSLLLVLVSWSMLDTVNYLVDKQFDRLERSDAQLSFADPTDTQAIEEVREVSGVEAVEPLTVSGVTIESDSGSYATRLIAPPLDTSMQSFDVVAGDAEDLSGEGVLLGDSTREELGIEVGDEVTLRIDLPGGEQRVRMGVAGFVSQPLGTFAYVDRSELAAALGVNEPAITGAQLTVADGASLDQVRRQVTELESVVAFRATDALQQVLDDAIGLFYAFVAAMLGAGAILAATVIFTIQSVSIAERSTEVATLRASGVRLADIAGMITVENLVVTLLGVVPGLVLGVIGGRLMFQTYSNDQFALEFVVRPMTLVWSALALVVVAVASQIPGVRALRRLDLAHTVRERSA